MLASVLDKRRGLVFTIVLLLLANLTAASAAAEPGVPPEIVAIIGADTDINPGETRNVIAAIVGFDEGGTFEFSGDGLTVGSVRERNGRYRIAVTADTVLPAGSRNLIVTNPDGLSGTYFGALTVTGDTPPPDTGDLTGHVFADLDGNGIEDGADIGLVAVSVSVVDSSGATHNVVTDGAGNFSILALPVGDATVTYANPSGMVATTANTVQAVSVVADSSVAAAAVGYQTVPNGDVAGQVFSDADGDGIRDGSEVGLEGVVVLVTDADGTAFAESTDGNGDYTITGLVSGDATVTYTTPVDHTLTTGNAVQTVAIVDGGLTIATDVGYQGPSTGDLTGHVFGDIDGDGIRNGYEVGLEGVVVLVTDADGTAFAESTDGNGDYTITGLVSGDATVTYTTPVDHTLTTGNAVQTVTIADGGLATAANVGFLGPSIGDVSGYVFSDFDGNGIEDGSDAPLRFVMVTITDIEGTVFTPVTNADGFYFQPGVATGDASVEFTTPMGYALTTGNQTQTVTAEYRLVKYSTPVGYSPPVGNVPEITGIRGNNEINQGQTLTFRVSVVNFVSGATFTVSGSDVTAAVIAARNGTARITVSAAATAAAGPRDLTLTNPDGLSATLENAIIVNASASDQSP